MNLYVVDYVMQDWSRSYLVCVYYISSECFVKNPSLETHLHAARAVCNNYMNFWPTPVALCIFGTTSPLVHAASPVAQLLRV